MARSISKPVGEGVFYPNGNLPDDVTIVQKLLNKVPSSEGGPMPLLTVNGKCDSKMIVAIRKFQRTIGAFDGRIDPGGKTLSHLNVYDVSGVPPITGTIPAIQDIVKDTLGGKYTSDVQDIIRDTLGGKHTSDVIKDTLGSVPIAKVNRVKIVEVALSFSNLSETDIKAYKEPWNANIDKTRPCGKVSDFDWENRYAKENAKFDWDMVQKVQDIKNWDSIPSHNGKIIPTLPARTVRRHGGLLLKNIFKACEGYGDEPNGKESKQWSIPNVVNGVMLAQERIPPGLSWCGIFAIYVLRDAGLSKLIWKKEGKGFGNQLNKSVDSNYQPGDVLVTKTDDLAGHYSIFLARDPQGKVWTVNGNSNGQSILVKPLIASKVVFYYNVDSYKF